MSVEVPVTKKQERSPQKSQCSCLCIHTPTTAPQTHTRVQGQSVNLSQVGSRTCPLSALGCKNPVFKHLDSVFCSWLFCSIFFSHSQPCCELRQLRVYSDQSRTEAPHPQINWTQLIPASPPLPTPSECSTLYWEAPCLSTTELEHGTENSGLEDCVWGKHRPPHPTSLAWHTLHPPSLALKTLHLLPSTDLTDLTLPAQTAALGAPEPVDRPLPVSQAICSSA